MKILLCTPPFHPYNLADEKIYITEPLQFEILSSLLDRKKFEVEVLDLRLERRKNTFARYLGKYRPDIVGFTAWTMHVNAVLELFRVVKTFAPNIYTIVGGHHTFFSPADFAREEVDFIVTGEAYTSFNRLLNHIYDGETDFSKIKGIAYQEGGNFFYNGQGVLDSNSQLDKLPFPDRTVVKKYLPHYFHLWWKPAASLRTAVGCPSRCNFCNLWKPNLGKYLTWSSDYIVDYLKNIEEHYVFFVDDHFLGNIERAYEIGESILKNNIKKEFCIYTRSDAVVENPDLIKLWAKIGLKRVRMGLETYSDQQLYSWNKENSIDNNDKAISTLKKYGVLTEGLFIIGLDYTEKEFTAMGKYIRSRKVEVPNITVYSPMPGTPDFIKNRNNMIYNHFEYFDFQHAVLKTSLDLKTFCKLYGKLLISVQRPPGEQVNIIGIKKYVKRMPSFFRYFWAVTKSYKHYQKEPAYTINKGYQARSKPLPWQKNTL